MGRMFPPQIPKEVLENPQRRAELVVYKALASQLGDEYQIYYSRPWLGVLPDGKEIDGEADFVIAHAEFGILTIEVKGGAIKLDSDNSWTSRDRHGFVHRIKNPVEQARNSKHQLLRKLKANRKWTSRFIRARHGVIFPDVQRPSEDLRPDMPLRLFAFAEDMSHLDAWVESRFVGDEPHENNEVVCPLGSDGISALEDLLARPVTLNVRLGNGIEQDIHEIRLKSNEQALILRDLEGVERLRVAGAAGTGKTILAAERAMRMAEEGRKTLLLCFNRALCNELKRGIGPRNNLTVSTFHQFARSAVRKAGVDPDAFSFEQIVEQFVKNSGRPGSEKFDALIIDEGQDFQQSWLESLECIVNAGAAGTLYVFYDDNQRVHGEGCVYLESLRGPRYHLSRNFRNTRKIFEQAGQYYSGGSVVAIGPIGSDVRWTAVGPSESLSSVIFARVSELIVSHGVRPCDIAVLVSSATEAEHLRRLGNSKLRRYGVTDAEARDEDKVVVDSVRRFKGLESPVIMLVLNEGMEQFDELVYTGMTRAQVVLEVFASRHLVDKLRRAATA